MELVGTVADSPDGRIRGLCSRAQSPGHPYRARVQPLEERVGTSAAPRARNGAGQAPSAIIPEAAPWGSDAEPSRRRGGSPLPLLPWSATNRVLPRCRGRRPGAWSLVPVGPRLPGHGEPHVDQPAGDLGDDVVGAIFVARDDATGDAVVGDGPAGVVGLSQHRVHALEHALGDTRGLPQPGWAREDEDLGGDDPLADALDCLWTTSRVITQNGSPTFRRCEVMRRRF